VDVEGPAGAGQAHPPGSRARQVCELCLEAFVHRAGHASTSLPHAARRASMGYPASSQSFFPSTYTLTSR
jgi:hypothetical protein